MPVQGETSTHAMRCSDGGLGTADMVRRAHKAGVEVFEVEVL